MTAVQLPPLEPGSDAWLRTMSASKIAAVVGLSPWHSRFSLWHQMAGLLPREPDNAVFRRGHYLEPAIAAWFADQHPTWWVGAGHCWAREDEPLFTAAPDREAVMEDGMTTVGVEIKTENDVEEYGPDGSDEIPAHYRAQVQWQMYVRGTRVTHVAVLTKYLEFREYVVPYDEADAEYLADEARAFMASLPGGPAECRPDIDAHGATYTAVKRMHPGIEQRDVEVPQTVADQYLELDALSKTVDAEKRAATSKLLDIMGDARRATVGGVVVARRQPASRGGVALYPIHAPIPRTIEDAA